MITPDLLQTAVGCTAELAATYAPHLDGACRHYGIDAPGRLAAFLAQIGHESGSFRWVREIADGSAYEGRRDLGNTEPGDGRRFRGRGLIQLTGRDNYRQMRDLLAHMGPPDFLIEPEALENPKWAAWSAAAWWKSRNLNALADADDFDRITRRINGGTNGAADRLARWERAKAVLVDVKSAENRQKTGNTPAENRQPSWPAGDSPDWPQPEKPMAPFVAAALSAVINAAPELIDMFKGDSKSAQRNSEAAKVVVGVAKEALGARNEQEIVERLQADPAAAAAVREAVQKQWFEIQQAAEKSIAEARKFGAEWTQMQNVRTVVGRFTFLEFLALVFLLTAWAAIGLLAAFNKVSEGTLDNIIMLAAVASIVGIREFWYGSSLGSRQKDEKGHQ